MVKSNLVRSAVVAAIATLGAAQANAQLALTADGIALGFTLSQFASTNPGYNSCCNGPFGVAVDVASGHVIVDVNSTGLRYAFNDVDGQTLASALSSAPSSTPAPGLMRRPAARPTVPSSRSRVMARSTMC